MTYYRFGQRLKLTRAVARAMSRSSASEQNIVNIQKLMQSSKTRLGSAVRRPLGAALATFLDSGVAFNTSSEFLYFDGEDDDGTRTIIIAATFDRNRIMNSNELLVSENFPRVLKPCEDVATNFFACFTEHGKQSRGESDAQVGNVALEKCKDVMLAYNSCIDAEVTKNPKEFFRVPKVYRMRE